MTADSARLPPSLNVNALFEPPNLAIQRPKFGIGLKAYLLTRHNSVIRAIMDTSINALEQALSIRRQIDALENRLAGLLGRTTSSHITISKSRGRHMSAAARAKIAASARARWARVKAGQNGAAKPRAKKGGITAAGRRRLSQLMKARWAARRKAQKK